MLIFCLFIPGIDLTTSGITSPALSTITVSPIHISKSLIIPKLCKFTRLTVTPLISTGSNNPTGVISFLPILHSIPINLVSP